MTNSWNSRRRRPRAGAALLALFAGLAWPGSVPAQEPDATNAADSLRAEVADLRARLDSLSRVVRELRSAGEPAEAEEAEDELARLRAAAAEAAGGGGEEADTADEGEEGQEGAFVGRQRSLQALNPEISVNVDVFGNLNTDDPSEDNFIPREFEFSFQSALDPFSRAKIYVSHHVPGAEIEPFGAEGGHAHGDGEGGGFGVEEGYLEWVGLPGGVGVTLGKFFQRFGTLNRWHAHALPFQSRSLPHLAYIGEESLSQTGVSVNWMLPVELGGTYETWLQVTRSGNEKLFGESDRPSFLGHLNGFWQLTPSLDLDLGVSGLFGEHRTEIESFDQRLYTVEGALTWRPPARSRYRELVLRGGWMLLDPSVPEEPHEPGAGEEEHAEFGGRAQGIWSMLDYKFSNQWHVGGRFDWAQDPADPDRSAWLAGPTLTWWQSEWVRLRAEWDYMDDGAETLSQLLLQVTFAMGPHKHETY